MREDIEDMMRVGQLFVAGADYEDLSKACEPYSDLYRNKTLVN